MLISGETARYELNHLNLHCLQKPRYIACGAERVNQVNQKVKSNAIHIYKEHSSTTSCNKPNKNFHFLSENNRNTRVEHFVYGCWKWHFRYHPECRLENIVKTNQNFASETCSCEINIVFKNRQLCLYRHFHLRFIRITEQILNPTMQ